MAAELLDIEAKLDTSQVQGQLQQLSKTSGLQNLDRAIRTLENSMKKLSAALDKQTAASTSSGGATESPLKFSRGVVRGIGVAMIGRSLSLAGNLVEQQGGSTGLKTAGKFASRIGGGMAAGALIGTTVLPGLGSLGGAAVGGAIGALQASFETLTQSAKNLNDAAKQLQQRFNTTFQTSRVLQENYGKRMFAEQVAGMSGNELDVTRIEQEVRLRRAKSREAEAQRALSEFENTTEWRNTLKYVSENNVTVKEFSDEAKKLQDEYERLTKAAANAAKETHNAEEALGVVQKRIGELETAAQKAAHEEQRRLELEERMEQRRERLRGDYSDRLRAFTHERSVEGIAGGTWTESDIQKGITSTTAKLQATQKDYQKTLEQASKSKDPEKFQSKVKELETTIAELKDVLSAWQKNLLEQTKEAATINFNPFGALGNLNAVERAGYINANGQNAIPNLVE